MNFNFLETSSNQTEILPYFNEENLETINKLISSAESFTKTDIKQLLTNTEDLLLDPQNLITLISDWQENKSPQPPGEKQTDSLTGEQFPQIQQRSDAGNNITYPFPEPGNNLLTAYNIGFVNETQTYSDFVDGYLDQLTQDYYDGNDYYRFSLDQTSDVEVVLSNLYDDAHLELVNSNGQLLQRSADSGSTNELISQEQLTAGDYYLRVYPEFRSFTSYDLTLNVEKTVPEDLAGNNRRRAYNIGELNSSEIFNDFVGDSDKHDFYKFEIEDYSQLDISLDELEANANIKLRNNRGRVIEKSTRRGDNFESISTELDPGKYYLQVYRHGRGQDTEYELSFDVTETQPDLAGNNRRQAYNIGELNSSEIFNDFVGDSDKHDFYKFEIEDYSQLDISLDELEANANIKLRNSRGRVIEKSTRRGDNFESISTELDPGKYYLQVYRHGRGQDTEYELSFDVTQTQPDIAGNNRRRAYNIGLLNGSEIFNEFVGENDPEDFYKFRLNETADVEVVLSELSEDADLQLLDSRGQLLQSFPENGTTPELIFGRLSRGTYYVNISSYFGANTDYQLSLFNWGV